MIGQKAENLKRLKEICSNLDAEVPAFYTIPAQQIERIKEDPARVSECHSLFDVLKKPLAVRSSGVKEDLEGASFAGQYETVLKIKTIEDFDAAILRCIDALDSLHLKAYCEKHGIEGPLPLALIVQEQVRAKVSGVLFTRNPHWSKAGVVIEATKGLGDRLVSGRVNPTRIEAGRDGSWIRSGDRLILGTAQVRNLLEVGLAIEEDFGHAVDIEFSFDRNWNLKILQARPITFIEQSPVEVVEAELTGLGVSKGVGVGPARVLKKPELEKVQDGEILVTKMTSPMWVSLFDRIGGIVTEKGGMLCHAAIVGREFGLPVVTTVKDATKLIKTGTPLRVDGSSGTVGTQ